MISVSFNSAWYRNWKANRQRRKTLKTIAKLWGDERSRGRSDELERVSRHLDRDLARRIRSKPGSNAAYADEARLTEPYSRIWGRTGTPLTSPKRLHHMHRRWRQWKGEDDSTAAMLLGWAWTPAVGVGVGVMLGVGAGSQTLQWSSFGGYYTIFQMLFLCVAGAAGGAGLGYVMYLTSAYNRCLAPVEIVERTDPTDPAVSPDVLERYDWRLSFLGCDPGMMQGSSGRTGMERGSVHVLLPQGKKLQDLDWRPYHGVRPLYLPDETDAVCLWPRPAPNFDLSRRDVALETAGIAPWTMEPERPSWTEVSDRERIGYLKDECQLEGEMSKARRQGVWNLAKNIGWAGGAFAFLFGFLLITSAG